MSKKFKSQASSSRAAAGGFGAFSSSLGGFSTASANDSHTHSSLSYVAEPPDLSRISHSQSTVAFKNVLKKDDTTKAKALEDLKNYLSDLESRSESVEDGFLEAWINIYPRTSIDNSRRVRQLAHTTQGLLASLTGKRIARQLPKVIGAWLAGLYDNDRSVARAAVESFTRVFPTDEKRNSLWKVYQRPILDFVDDVILHHTVLTLSDERTVRPDDAEAKYARVSATAILLLNRIISSASDQDLQKDQPLILTLLCAKQLWSLSRHEDPFVRRSLFNLLCSVLQKNIEGVDWKQISVSIIGKALGSPQLGSAAELSEALLQLTRTRPVIWTSDYSGKSPASKRLHQYLERGSQGGNETYWFYIAEILQSLPKELIIAGGDPDTVYSNITALAESVRRGLNSRDEPRQNLKAGWNSYIQIGLWLTTFAVNNDRSKFVEDTILPLVEHYIIQTADGSPWDLPPQVAEEICTNCFVRLAEHGYYEALKTSWKRVFEKLDQAIRLSSPEQSKNFKVSQDSICDQARRVFGLEAAVIERVGDSSSDSQIMSLFETINHPFLVECLQILAARKGKPYGAASMVEEATRNVPMIISNSPEVLDSLKEEVILLLDSPSAERAVSIVLLCKNWDGFDPIFQECVTRLTESQLETSNNSALRNLFATIDFRQYADLTRFNELITKVLEKAFSGDRTQWQLMGSLLENQTLPAETLETFFALILEALSSDDRVIEGLSGLEYIASRSPTSIRRLRKGADASKLIAKVLLLAESPNEEVAVNAERLEKQLKDSLPSAVSNETSLEILQSSFINVNEESLSVESLVMIAVNLIQSLKPEDRPAAANKLIPNQQMWRNALEPFLNLPPRPSTAITSPLGGVVQLIEYQFSDAFWERLQTVPRDSEGYSSAYRLLSYTAKLLSTVAVLEYLSVEQREGLFYFFPLGLQLVDDDMSIAGSNGMTSIEGAEDREEIANIAQLGRKLVDTWIHSGPLSGSDAQESVSSALATLWTRKLDELENASTESYRVGETFTKILVEVESQKLTRKQDSFDNISREIRSLNVIRAAATLTVWRESILSNPSGTRLCNEMVADSTGLRPEARPREALQKLAFLNLLLQGDDGFIPSIPTQRLVFLVKHLIECIEPDDALPTIKAEIFKVMAIILKQMKDIFGSHWNDIIEILISTWKSMNESDEALPVIHSSLRLYACLKTLVLSESNEDLEEVWSESQDRLANGLIWVLQKIDSSSPFHQPRDITLDLLSRQLATVKVDALAGTSDLYHLLAAQSDSIQQSVYSILHRVIPKAQEQISFEVALSKIAASLPDELLSLLLEPPRIETFSSEQYKDGAWARLKTYLLSWKLVFDHFSGSSLPVQENYATNIREHDVLNPLMEFTFGFLERSHGKLVDASKITIRAYEPGQTDSPREEIERLLVHLYYLAAKFLPTLTKNWWIDSKKRIKGPVETWTQKYISPLLIEDSLNNVSEWIKTQDPDDERPLVVKVSQRAAELVASITIDEESPPVAMAISLPPGYPLQPALVTGRSRVLVDEKKWRSWLLIVQGVIMFSNGNLVDGLLTFRRNVQGALKGHGECAICYSVISTDMQTPNKKCATCKNTFHSVCLFRWFKSSNQSTCPLCRNNFSF